MIFLICNWLLEAEFKEKWERLKSNKSILIFTGIFWVHILWLINTQNFEYAFHDLSNKAILLLYPVIIGTSQKLNSKQIKAILFWFSLAVLSSTIISSLILVGIIDYPVQSIRNISVFMSHIRLSLLVNIAIYSLGYLIFTKNVTTSKVENVVYVLFIIWLIIFLFLLKSLTGIIVFSVLFFAVLTWVSLKIVDVVPRLFLQVFLIGIFLLLASYITHSISRYYSKERVDFNNLDQYTANDNLYNHYTNRTQIENGNYVWLYICPAELKSEWNKVSDIPYSKKVKKGQQIQYTLLRYLTSKGLRKDSIGISKLSPSDIKNIENGMANHIFANKYAIYPKIYEAIWQFDVYRQGLDPAGNSITLRVVFAKTAVDIIKNNFWFGVGTGDVQDSFNRQYEQNNSNLPQKNRLRAHNQYITFFVSFGLVGFVLICFFLFYPTIKNKEFNNYLFLIVFIISLLSFINEDTLETQIGITFFSYFYSLFLFGSKTNFKNEKD